MLNTSYRSSFSRKHYILIADALQQSIRPLQFAVESGSTSYTDVLRGFNKAIESLSAALVKDNPRFNAEHFLAVVRGEKALHSRPSRNGVRS